MNTTHLHDFGTLTDGSPDQALGAYGRRLNGYLDEAARQQLVPLISLLAGASNSPELEKRRGYFFADTAVRRFTPLALRVIGLEVRAAALEGLPAIVDITTAKAAARAASNAAWAAAEVVDIAAPSVAQAAWAAESAAWCAARATAWCGARAAAGAAAEAAEAAAEAASEAADWPPEEAAIAAKVPIWDLSIQVFREAIQIQ